MNLKGWYHPTESWRAVGEFWTNASGDFTEARNDFPWQRFALHGELPIESKVYDRGAGNPSNSVSNPTLINNEFIASVVYAQHGLYVFNIKPGYDYDDFITKNQTTETSTTSQHIGFWYISTAVFRFVSSTTPGFYLLDKTFNSSPGRFRMMWTLAGIKRERFDLWNSLK